MPPVTAAAQDGHAGAGIAQPLRHEPPERTGTARDQDRCWHDVSLRRQDEPGPDYRLHGHHPWQRPTGQSLAPAGHGPDDGTALLHVRPLTGQTPAANRKSPGSVIRLPSDTGRPGGSASRGRLCRAATRRRPRRPVCIYNPDLDPGRHGADAIISYITQAITASNQPAHCGRALIRLIRRGSRVVASGTSGLP